MAEYLIAKGHVNALNYVMRQAVTLYHLAGNRERVELGALLNVTRIAHHADDKHYKDAIDTFK